MRKWLLSLVAVLLFSLPLFAQKTITGKVTDDKGDPLMNVSVIAKGTTTGTVTKPDGTYTLSVPAGARILVFSSVDMVTVEVEIGTKVLINASLRADDKSLGEVVITGYARQKKSEYSGSVAKVTGEQIRNIPAGSFDQMLQGRAPGLTVLSGSGQPGTAANVVLRGATSITGGNQPLYVIDGLPVEASVFQTINPNDIESIDVLKDASAAALYGSRGAAGIIVVTTRRGQAGKLKFSYAGQYGITLQPNFNYPMMNTAELLQAQEDLGFIANTVAVPGWQLSPRNPVNMAASPAQQAIVAAMRDSISKIQTDWDDIFFRQGTFQRHEMSVSGGTGKTRFYSNLGYYGEQGITQRTDLNRLTWRNNVDFADEKWTISFSSSTGIAKRNFQESDVANSTRNPFFATRLTPSYVPLYRPGTQILNVGVGNHFSGPNTYERTVIYNKAYNDQLKLINSLNISYKFTPNVTAAVLAGADFRETQNTTFSDPRAFDNTQSTDIRTRSGSITEALTRFFQFNLRGSLNFNKTFGGKHEVDVTGIGEFIKNKTKTLSLQGFGIDPRRPNTLAGITNGSVQNQLVAIINGNRSQRAIGSGIALLRYTFNKKYTLNASYRYDGSSQLPELNRFKSFYSAGLTWDMKREEFLKNTSFLNQLTLRATYGSSANADNFPFGDFGYLPQFALGTDGAGQQTLVVSTLGNSEATWEFTKQLNIGVDFGFLKNRIYGSIDVYNKITDKTFLNQSLSLTTGFGAISSNAGEVRNRGIEYSLNFVVMNKEDFNWTVFVNGAYNKNEVTGLGQVANFQQGTALVSVGKPLATHWEVGYAGLEPASGRPLYYDLHGNVTNTYSTANRVQRWGTSIPPWTGGFGTDLRYKGLSLSVFLNYVDETYRVNNLEFFVENPNGFLPGQINQARDMRFWRFPGDMDALTQSPLFQNQFSSKYIQDASFLRLRNVTLAYTIPTHIVSRLGFLSQARLYMTGQNLYAWTNWKGYDPEDSNNISLSEFPNPRTITIGIDLTF